jgi:hypothetical protein
MRMLHVALATLVTYTMTMTTTVACKAYVLYHTAELHPTSTHAEVQRTQKVLQLPGSSSSMHLAHNIWQLSTVHPARQFCGGGAVTRIA